MEKKKYLKNKNKVIFVLGTILIFCIILIQKYDIRFLVGNIAMIFINIIYFLISYFVIKTTKIIDVIKKITLREMIIIFIMGSCSILVVYALMMREHEFIYYWDYAGYYKMTLGQIVNFHTSPINTLGWIYNSLANEYNLTIPSILAFPLYILGENYSTYVILNHSLFVIPTCFVYTILIENISYKFSFKYKIPIHYVFCFFLISSSFYVPTLNGYADATCIYYISLAYLFLFSNKFEEYNKRDTVILAILLVTLLIMRRAYAFWIVGYGLTLIIYIIGYTLSFNENRKHIFTVLLKKVIFIVTISFIFLICFFSKFFISAVNMNIGVSYSAWDVFNNYEKFITTIKYYGTSIVVIFIILCIIQWRSKTKNISISIMIPNILIIILMCTIGTFGVHTYYQFSGQLIFLIVLGLLNIYNYKFFKSKVIYAIIFVYFINILNFMNSINILEDNKLYNFMFTNQVFYPKKTEGINTIKAMASDLAELSKNKKRIYVLASSHKINDDIIRNSNLPNKVDGLDLLSYTAHADLRDGFPLDFLESEYIVVASPVQYHIIPDGQRVIGILSNEMLKEKTKISDNFTKIKSYSLESDDNIKIYIYKKISDFSEEDLNFLINTFDLYYSDYPDLFRNRIEKYKIS